MTNPSLDELETDPHFWGLFSVVYNSWNRGYTMTGMSLTGRALTPKEVAYVVEDCRAWAHRVASVVRGMGHVMINDHPALKDRVQRIVEDVHSLAEEYRDMMGWKELENVEKRIGNE